MLCIFLGFPIGSTRILDPEVGDSKDFTESVLPKTVFGDAKDFTESVLPENAQHFLSFPDRCPVYFAAVMGCQRFVWGGTE